MALYPIALADFCLFTEFLDYDDPEATAADIASIRAQSADADRMFGGCQKIIHVNMPKPSRNEPLSQQMREDARTLLLQWLSTRTDAYLPPKMAQLHDRGRKAGRSGLRGLSAAQRLAAQHDKALQEQLAQEAAVEEEWRRVETLRFKAQELEAERLKKAYKAEQQYLQAQELKRLQAEAEARALEAEAHPIRPRGRGRK